MRRIALLVTCLVPLAFAVPAAGDYRDPRLDKYKLWFSGLLTRSWQNHTLTIEVLTDGRIEGQVAIDANIGPEGREPMAWERGYTLPFAGTFDAARERFEFTVKVPWQREQAWKFTGYLFRARGGAFAAGTLSIEGKEVSGFVASRDPQFKL